MLWVSLGGGTWDVHQRASISAHPSSKDGAKGLGEQDISTSIEQVVHYAGVGAERVDECRAWQDLAGKDAICRSASSATRKGGWCGKVVSYVPRF